LVALSNAFSILLKDCFIEKQIFQYFSIILKPIASSDWKNSILYWIWAVEACRLNFEIRLNFSILKIQYFWTKILNFTYQKYWILHIKNIEFYISKILNFTYQKYWILHIKNIEFCIIKILNFASPNIEFYIRDILNFH
jgi:hypothetical protein